MTDSNKITIKFDGKEYEIEKTDKEQKVKPKSAKAEDNDSQRSKEVTFKNYKTGKWNHTIQVKKDGESEFKEVAVKWGTGKHATVWGLSSAIIIGGLVAGWWFFLRGEENKD